ncbi:hypothetical protein JCM10212_003607 [Sporobolomyces blumeae]
MSSTYHPPPIGSYSADSTTLDSSASHSRSSYADRTPLSSTATPSSSYFSQPVASPPLGHVDDAPQIGSTRCYWVIMSPSLEFMYLDPILEYHMVEYSRTLIGYNLLDFVHPDERNRLAQDLLPDPNRSAGVKTAGVFGSVTRVRYARLTGILRKMGCAEVREPPQTDKYALDDTYCQLDLATSWIAGHAASPKGKDKADAVGQGAILAFMHVVGDKDHVKNNDVYDRGDWTNWCGVQFDEHAYFTPSRCAALVDVLERITSSSSRPSTAMSEPDSKSAILASVHGLGSETTDGPPPHVFQILDRNGRTIVSFPTSIDKDGRKRYEVEDYATLARDVVARPRGAANARTSCTKRYRSKHPVMKDGALTTVESVVIMYGHVTFACFETGGIYLTSARKAALGLSHNGMPTTPGSATRDFNLEDVPSTSIGLTGAYASTKRPSPANGDPFHERTHSATKRPRGDSNPVSRFPQHPTVPKPSVGDSYSPGGLSISTAAASRAYRPSIESEYGANGGVSPTVASASAILGSISSNHVEAPPPSTSTPAAQPAQPASEPLSYRSSTFPYSHHDSNSPAPYYSSYYSPSATSPYQHHAYQQQQQHDSYFPASIPPASSEQPAYAPVSAEHSAGPSHNASPPLFHPSTTTPAKEPTPLESPTNEAPGGIGPEEKDAKAPQVASSAGAKEGKKGRTRPEGPVFKPGLKACESCQTVNSPEWRKGPSGAKSLCNACGLRYARSVARQKKLAEQAATGVVSSSGSKKKKSSPSTKGANGNGDEFDDSNLPTSSSAHTTYDPPFSRGSPLPGQKPYTPYYTTAPPHSGSYALAAAHAASSGPSNSSISTAPLYPASTSGYYPATSAYPVSTYPPTSAPILTHIPIHHTLAATLPPLSAPATIHASNDYSRHGSLPTSMAESPFSHLDHLNALSQPPSSGALYPPHSSVNGSSDHSTSSGGWQPHYTSVAQPHPPTSVPHSAATSSMPSPPLALPPTSTSPHLHPLQQHQHRQSSYQPYPMWPNGDHQNSSAQEHSAPPLRLPMYDHESSRNSEER